ncbi:methyltransferase domain-containing protein [Nocardioides sp. TRM66260-LWL]|uniref:methyltransferase domain-containing protein n=1 Tax=Nocardioides sp. TRM66260-LWL TaxID=2874478 RepID=UPI001CC5F3D2|nr:methyltransferase domain-containing protein [Nocardioides sp. TRM66260-LWL]MBZ5735276.1 methyltransferase domain-containing protein [Nocardioides sp. TRM66260-LWL]
MTAPPARTRTIGGLPIGYDERVLEPRPWTAAQARWAAELAADQPPGRLLELCCGAGHIGLLAAHLTGRALLAVDLSPAASAWTRRNADALGVGDRVEVRQGRLEDGWEPDDERFPVVLADPPWVPSAEVGRFPDDPVLAIDGGVEGLDVARLCLRVAAARLRPAGVVVLQLGTPAQVHALVATAGSLGLALLGTRQEERGVLAVWAAHGPGRPGHRPAGAHAPDRPAIEEAPR